MPFFSKISDNHLGLQWRRQPFNTITCSKALVFLSKICKAFLVSAFLCSMFPIATLSNRSFTCLMLRLQNTWETNIILILLHNNYIHSQTLNKRRNSSEELFKMSKIAKFNSKINMEFYYIVINTGNKIQRILTYPYKVCKIVYLIFKLHMFWLPAELGRVSQTNDSTQTTYFARLYFPS